MRHAISGLIATVFVMTASAAQACGGGLFQDSCSPCGWGYVSLCAHSAYGCNTGCGAYERLPDPVPHHYSSYQHQYYYVNQGPTYTGPGNFAPYRTYQEGYVAPSYRYGYNGGYNAPAYQGAGVDYGYRPHRYYRPWRARTSYYHTPRVNYNYGYAPRHYGYASRHYGYAPRRAYAPHYSARYAPAPYHYGHRVLRRYY